MTKSGMETENSLHFLVLIYQIDRNFIEQNVFNQIKYNDNNTYKKGKKRAICYYDFSLIP